jgi:hypothetical protein
MYSKLAVVLLLPICFCGSDRQQYADRHAQHRRCTSCHHQCHLHVVDNLGKQATANTSVTVTAPSTPVAPQTRNLCSISFERDRRRPVRVDNEAKGCLDEVALTLIRDKTTKLVIVGKHSADEHPMLRHNATSMSRNTSRKRKASIPHASRYEPAASSIAASTTSWFLSAQASFPATPTPSIRTR